VAHSSNNREWLLPLARLTYRRCVDDDRLTDLEIKLAYQDQLIRELDALVRAFGDKLDHAEREIATLKQSLRSPEVGIGPANDKPPHY
jgi:uncharacterized coiled-coil protein SlyX